MPNTIASSRTFHPEQLDAEGRARLLEDLQINRQIFEGPGLGALIEALASGSQAKTTLQCYYDGDGRCVGFAALLCDEFDQDGEPWSVFRAMTGLLPAYRGRQSVTGFYLSTLTGYLLRHPGRRVFFFTPVVHASSYRLLARYAKEMYPHPDRPVPARMMEIIQRLGARYACAKVDGAHPLICRRSAWTRGDQQKQARRLQAGDALDRFFLEINPGAGEGHCIMTLAPVTIGQLLVGALRYGRTRAAVQLRGLRGAWAGGGLLEGAA